MDGSRFIKVIGFVNNRYRFLTWNTKQDGTGTSYRQGETIYIYDDLEVWAIWQKVWILQVDPNGGRWYDGDSLTLAHGYGDTQVIDLEPTYQWYDRKVQFRMQVLDKRKQRILQDLGMISLVGSLNNNKEYRPQEL